MQVYELYQAPCACSYLPHLEASFKYFYIKQCTKEFYNILLMRGWRRFGNYFFAPRCDGCSACVSIRYDCVLFEFSKSQKRILKNPIKLEIKKPHITQEHLELYAKYHAKMSIKKGWSEKNCGVEGYYDSFVQGALDFGYEFDYYIENKLVGVALIDILDSCISAVYCYYDHDFSKYSIGTYSILKQIEIAKKYNIRYLYPGYLIYNHHSMGYKEKFKPFEVLTNMPDINEIPLWVKE
ncbi:MAG: arginyltransferase [Helicobacteraceae bacterium]|nr:arginyltransferase [Helicobacteraceae bacterium]